MPARHPRKFIILTTFLGAMALYAGCHLTRPPREAPPSHPLTDRPIAGIATDTRWLDREERIQEETPDRALDLIGVEPGMVVADVGAGTGFFTTRLATRVSPGGQVYATDIQPEMLRILRDRTRDLELSNVVIIQSTQTDARLPEGALDLILLVDVYHEFRYPQQMLRALRLALKPAGRLVLLEYRKEDPALPIMPTHRMSVANARTEVEAEGFVFDRVIPDLSRQHILVFRRGAGPSR